MEEFEKADRVVEALAELGLDLESIEDLANREWLHQVEAGAPSKHERRLRWLRVASSARIARRTLGEVA